MFHIIGEAIFDITFGSEKQGEAYEPDLERMVQSRLLPVVEEVFDEMALDREAVRIDCLEVDLGPVRDEELEIELAARLREKLRDALRDYVLARERTVVAGTSQVSHSPADLEKLAYFLRYGHLTWDTRMGKSYSVVDLLESAVLQSPDQISRLFDGGADFDTVIFRLAAQFPENAVQDLVDRLARADPALASKIAAALRIHERKSTAGPRAGSDEQGIIRAYELYDRLRRQLTAGDARDAPDLGPVIEELQRKYPWQLLRLYRELQAGEGLSIRIPDFYGVEDLRRLVDAFLSVVGETTNSIADFRQSIALFAEKSADRRAYYTQVLHRLIRNEVLDLEEFSTHSAPAKGSGGDEDIQSLLTGHPARAREWFRQIAADPLALHALIERQPERWFLRLLHLFQESVADRMLLAADAVIESAYVAGMKLPYAKIALLKWEFILSTAVKEGKSFEKERFTEEFGQLISGDVPQASRELFLSQVHDGPFVPEAQTSLNWDVLIRSYDLYDMVLQQLDEKEFREESRDLGAALQELLQKYPHQVRRLYREVQADTGMSIRIQWMLSLADLAGLLDVFLAVAYPVGARVAPLVEVIAQRATLSEDPRRYLRQVLRRLLRPHDVNEQTLAAEPSAEESDEQVFEGMMLILEGRTGKFLEVDLVRRFDAILRDRPERAQHWLLDVLSSTETSERAIDLLREPALLEVFRRLGGEGLAVLIRTADAVADTFPGDRASISERELLRLKWAFLFRYAIQEGFDSEPEAFSAAFVHHLSEHSLPASERVRGIQLKLWDRSQPLDERFLVQSLRSLEMPAGQRLLLQADAVAHAFYRAGLGLPQGEIARLKWQMIFSDALLEEADLHAEEFAANFESLLRDRMVAANPEDVRFVDVPVPQQPDWNGWVRAYELYDLLRRALIDGKPYRAADVMTVLDETLRLHAWQLLRLYREMRAGDGLSVRVMDSYDAGELRRLAAALLRVSAENVHTAQEITEAIAAFEPYRAKEDDLRIYYADVLEQLVNIGRPPALAAELASASLAEKALWIQARLRDRSQNLPERFLVHVLSRMDSPAVKSLLQSADSIVDSYYRAGLALPHGEMARLKWEVVFSDALLEAPETHAAKFAEHFEVLIHGRLDDESSPASSAAIPAPVPVATEFAWTSWTRAYELYDRLRQTLVDGKAPGTSGLMEAIEETLRLYPWQLLRLYREMQAGEGLSARLKDFFGVEELRRLTEALLAVSEADSRAVVDAVAAFEPAAEDLRVYYVEVLEELVQTRRPPAFAAQLITASLPEKVRWIQARLRDRSQPLLERLFVRILSEIDSAVTEGLLRTADAVADSYYRATAALPQSEIARLKWSLIFSDALLEEPEPHAAEFAEHFRFLLDERVDSAGTIELPISPSPASGWSAWIRAYELYDRLRRLLVAGGPDSASGLMSALEETLRLHPWQLLRLYREMQAGDGMSVRVKALYGAGELQRIAEAFLTVSEEKPGAFDGLKKSIAAFAQQSKDRRLYYAALLQQLVRAEVIDLELALTRSSEEQPLRQLTGLTGLVELAQSGDERAESQLISLLRGWRKSEPAPLLTAVDAVIQSRISGAPTSDQLDLIRLKWEFLFSYPISEQPVFDRAEFENEFVRFLGDRSREGIKPGELEPSAEWGDLARSYDLYDDLRLALLSTGAVRTDVRELVEELAQSYPWQIRKLYRELESTALQAGILRSRDAASLRSLIAAFARAVRLDPAVAAIIEQELATESPDDAVQRYSRVLERLIHRRVTERESAAPPPPKSSPQVDDARELIRTAEGLLRSGVERLRAWIEEIFSSSGAGGATGERLVRLLPEGLIARILTAGAPTSSPALLMVVAERLAMAAATPLVGLSPQRARELKWLFVLRYAIVEKHSFAESQFVRGFAAFIVSETQSASAEILAATLAGEMKVDGMSALVRQEEDKTYGAIELERGIPVLNAGMVLAAPYLPKLFAELNLTEGRKFRDDEARERAVHLLQFMVNESEDTAEHELVLNKILCGMDTAAPIQRRIELADREKVMIEGLIRGMILNWKKLGQTSVAGFRESFLQREGALRLTGDAWRIEVFPKPFDMLLDYIPWTFETIKHPWMERIVHVQWR